MALLSIWRHIFLCMFTIYEVSGYSTVNSPKAKSTFVFPFGGRYNKVHHPAAYDTLKIDYNYDNHGQYQPIQFPSEFTELHQRPNLPRYKGSVPVFNHVENTHGYNNVGFAFPHHAPPYMLNMYPAFVDYSYQGLGYGYPGYGK